MGKLKSIEKKKQPVEIPVDDMTISKDELNLTVLKIKNKRLSVSLYRQLPIIHIIEYVKNKDNTLIGYYDPDTSKPILQGKIVGKVASTVRHSGNYRYGPGRDQDVQFDILWIAKNGTLAICPISWIVDDLHKVDLVEMPNHINIFNNHYLCTLKISCKVLNVDYGKLNIEEWDKFHEIPQRPQRPKFIVDSHSHCGYTNDKRLVMIESLKTDIDLSNKYNKDMEEWASITHPIYDAFMDQITPLVVEINNITKKRNKVYQDIIEEFNSYQQIFVGS